MSIKSIVGMLMEIRSGKVEDLMSNEMTERTSALREELFLSSEKAASIITSKLDEGDFVKLMAMIQKSVVAELATKGCTGMLRADMGNELQMYTHSVILATIGLLIQDEIL